MLEISSRDSFDGHIRANSCESEQQRPAESCEDCLFCGRLQARRPCAFTEDHVTAVIQRLHLKLLIQMIKPSPSCICLS